MPDFPDFSWDRVPNGPFDDRLWWVLIALCVALLLTVQGIETALEGAWPHQRRSSRLFPASGPSSYPGGPWPCSSFRALAVDRDCRDRAVARSRVARLHHSWNRADRIGWGFFLLFSLDTRWFGRLFSNLGLIGPIALAVLLVTGDTLLLSTFLDIVPDWDTLIDSIEHGLRDFLPFVDEEG